MAAKNTTSCFSFLTRIPTLLAPFLLFAVGSILQPAVRFVYSNPLTAEISRHFSEMEEHTDPSSAEYARLVEETRHDATRLLIISIALALVTLTLAFAKRVVARFFAASSTTSSSPGDRFSLAELLREVKNWHNMRGPLVTTAAVVTVVQLASMALLGGNFVTALMGDSGLLSARGSLFLAAFLAIFYLGDLALMIVAIRRKECSMMVLVALLLPALMIPVCAVAALYLYTEQVIGLGISLLSVYDILQGVQDMLYLSAANVYCYCYYQAKSMDQSKGI
ncbi:hypothetical protein ACQ4PT_026423 [Festuca glaucescens]